MSNDQKVVTDPSVYTELSAQQRVMTVLQLAGHTPEQIDNLTRRHSHIGVLVNNIATCRDVRHKVACDEMRTKAEAELMANQPPSSTRRWTPLEELELIITAAGDSKVPVQLRRAFDTSRSLQADPV